MAPLATAAMGRRQRARRWRIPSATVSENWPGNPERRWRSRIAPMVCPVRNARWRAQPPPAPLRASGVAKASSGHSGAEKSRTPTRNAPPCNLGPWSDFGKQPAKRARPAQSTTNPAAPSTAAETPSARRPATGAPIFPRQRPRCHSIAPFPPGCGGARSQKRRATTRNASIWDVPEPIDVATERLKEQESQQVERNDWLRLLSRVKSTRPTSDAAPNTSVDNTRPDISAFGSEDLCL